MKDLAIDDHFISLEKTLLSAKIEDSSPCFDIDFIRLGSAPPYRKSNLLPELSNVTPRSVRLQEKKLERRKTSVSYNDVKDGDKDKNITFYKKEHITKSNTRRLNHLGKPDKDSKFSKDSNDIKSSVLKERTGHHSPEHVLIPRRVSKTVLARQSFNSKDSLLTYKNEQRCSEAYDKLKIAGIAITKSKVLPNDQKSDKNGNYTNEFPKTVEKQKNNFSILKHTSRPDFYYRKRNSNLSNNKNTRTLNYVGHTIKRAELFHRAYHKFENNSEVNTLDEYCRLEDQRYYIEAQNIKKFLFQRWLSNIEGHLDELETTGSSSSETNKSSSEFNEEDEYHFGSS